MLLYIAVISVINLCLGYALAIYLGAVPGARHAVAPSFSPTGGPLHALGDKDEDATLTNGAQTPTAPASTALAESALDDESADPEPSEPTAAEADETPPTERVDLGEYMTGLDAFQAQLAAMTAQLADADDDADGQVVRQCADQITSSSDDYLDQASQACEQLSPQAEDPEILANEKEQLRQSISDQSERVKSQSDAIREIEIERGIGKAREALLATTAELSDVASQLKDDLVSVMADAEKQFAAELENAAKSVEAIETVDDAADQLVGMEAIFDSERPLDRLTGLATREWAEDALDQLQWSLASDELVFVALLDLDHADKLNAEHGKSTGDRIIGRIGKLAQQSISTTHAAARFSGQQYLLLMPGESDDSATRIVEQFRKEIEATKFKTGDKSIRLTVSGAVAEVSRELERETVVSRLEEAIAEAKRYGRNRTFWHDGTSPVPTIAADLAVAPRVEQL
jgi:diguanylate cyclase (GGDEF)-like protein